MTQTEKIALIVAHKKDGVDGVFKLMKFEKDGPTDQIVAQNSQRMDFEDSDDGESSSGFLPAP